MDKGILLATETLVESICHYIRDSSGVFFVCHAHEWRYSLFSFGFNRQLKIRKKYLRMTQYFQQ